MRHYLLILALISAIGCQETKLNSTHLLHAIAPELEGQWVNIVVEIPTGSTEKWEVNKETGTIERDSINGQPRTVQYLGYPGNYGFIPQTLLPKAAGGDGDPLDIIVLGPAVERGTVIRCKIIGVLKLLDNGEQDDKLIAVAKETPLSTVFDIAQLDKEFPGILEIIATWFSNYKGAGEMQSEGFKPAAEALSVLEKAIEAY